MLGIELPFSNLDLLAVGVVIAGMLILGAVVYFSDRSNASNRIFFFFCITTIIWSFLNYAFYHVPDPANAFWVIRGVIASAAWLVFFLFMFLFTFPYRKSPTTKANIIAMYVVTFGISILNLSPFVFKEVTSVASDNTITGISNGPGIYIFAIFVLCCVLGGLSFFVSKLTKTKGIDRRPMLIILAGILVTFLCLLTFNFVLPAFLANPYFIQYGAIFIFPFIIATSFALLKYHFLNAKAVVVGGLSALLALVTFFEIVFSPNLEVTL